MTTSNDDMQLQQAVLDELARDTRIDRADIGVEARGGIVTLTGTVTTWAKKLAAEDIAHRVNGVTDIANEVVVRLPGSARRGDSELAAAIRQTLARSVLVPADRIRTTVSEGIVRLLGTVETSLQREEAARAVGHVDGVCAIDNQLVVERAAVSTAQLESVILHALDKRADRELKGIRVAIDDGCVTLSGRVQSWREHTAVVGAIRGIRGVVRVLDRLDTLP
jgi:osmotically-inducible protein OsmY